jgi:hypothetical protein
VGSENGGGGSSFVAESEDEGVKSDRESFQVESDHEGEKSSFVDGEMAMLDSPDKRHEEGD